DGIRDRNVTGVQTCALPIYTPAMPTIRFSGISTFTFFRLCTRAPRTKILPGAALSVLICGCLHFAVSFAAIVPRCAEGGKRDGGRPAKPKPPDSMAEPGAK